MPEHVELAAIVNSFNRLSLLQEGLPALYSALAALQQPAAIVVFDAGSSDGSRLWLEKFVEEHEQIAVHLIYPEPGQDSSFSAGVNLSAARAEELFPQLKWLFFYETDNWIANSGPIETAVRLLNNQAGLAAVGFTVRSHNGQPVGFGCSLPSVFQFILGPQLSFLLRLDRPHLNQGGTIDQIRWYFCDVVFTSPLVVAKEAWSQSQGMDYKNFPFSECDIDWALRLHKLGWKLSVLETSDVVHDNRQVLSDWSSTRVVHLHRARLRLLRKHGGTWISAIKPLLFLRHILELMVLCVAVFFFHYPRESIAKRWLLLKTVWRNYELSERSGT